jgi:pyruvate formate lyase activating enzyme
MAFKTMNELFSDVRQLIGFQKTSMVDYPGRLASVIFFPFCNMRCPWCHNGALILNRQGGGTLIPLVEALYHMVKRRSMLGGIVLSGGEATLYSRLPELISRVKDLGLLVKLDTNGTRPDVLEKLISSQETRPDYIAMDLKVAPRRYAGLMAEFKAESRSAGMKALEFTEAETAHLIERSAAIIRTSGIEHEFRSLNLPESYLTEDDKDAMRPLADGSLWNFRPLIRDNCLDPSWNEEQ